MAAPPVPPPPPPPVPPRPYELGSGSSQQQLTFSSNASYTSYGAANGGEASTGNRPPPLPPLPPDLIRAQQQQQYQQAPQQQPMLPPLDFVGGGGIGHGDSQPHFENPLIAPRPHRVDPSIPLNMARTLDDQITPGFIVPPPSAQQASSVNWTHYASQPSSDPNPYVNQNITQLTASFNSSLSMNSPAPPPTDLPPLTAPIPLLSQLAEAAPKIQAPTHDPSLKISWARDVLFLIERAQGSLTSTDPPIGPLNLPPSPENTTLEGLGNIAVQIVLQVSNIPSKGKKIPPYTAEALYYRASLAATGAFPSYVPHNPRTAFRDYEAAARGGYGAAWFRLGRDYENFKDDAHAKECFERGVKANVGSCVYRMGMAHLLGQLSLSPNPRTALPLLALSAHLATQRVAQPAYVYALLLLSEFTSIAPLPPTLFSSLSSLSNPPRPLIPPNSSPSLEARKHLERAAFLGFGAAQYKLGHAYEFAEPPWPFDPVMSVRWYSAASESGEPEADMALSKWFLCGSGGAALSTENTTGGFDKDESLALLFAEKAARKGLPSAEFAMGYYAEVGVGQGRDLARARGWYELAHAHNNPDASARLAALSQPSPSTLTREEHETLTETKLVRRRTLAAQRSENEPLSPPWEGRVFPSARKWEEEGSEGPPDPDAGQAQARGRQQVPGQRRRQDGRLVVDVIRKNSMAVRQQQQQQQQVPPQSAPVGGPGVMTSVPVGGFMGGPAARRDQSPSSAQPQRRTQSRERYQQGAGGAYTNQNYPQSAAPQTQTQTRRRYDSGPGPASASASSSPARNGRTTPPAPQGGRAPSPGRYLGGAAVAGGGRPGLPIGGPNPTQTQAQPGRRSDSPGRGRAAEGPGAGRSKLERMRLNLDDPGPVPVSSMSSSSSTPVGYTLTDTYTPATATAGTTPGVMNTPRPGKAGQGVGGGMTGGGGTAGGGGTGGGQGGGKYPQTFAEMGFHGAKAEEKDCVIM